MQLAIGYIDEVIEVGDFSYYICNCIITVSYVSLSLVLMYCIDTIYVSLIPLVALLRTMRIDANVEFCFYSKKAAWTDGSLSWRKSKLGKAFCFISS